MREYLYKYMMFLVGLTILNGCLPSYRTIHTEAVVKDSLSISHRFIDKTIYRDRVFERWRNDTLYIYKERLVDRYIYTGDTVYIERRDSISVPIPVERQLTKWERFKMDWGVRFMVISLILVLLIFYRVFRARGKI